jgi:hypothetical protein
MAMLQLTTRRRRVLYLIGATILTGLVAICLDYAVGPTSALYPSNWLGRTLVVGCLMALLSQMYPQLVARWWLLPSWLLLVAAVAYTVQHW